LHSKILGKYLFLPAFGRKQMKKNILNISAVLILSVLLTSELSMAGKKVKNRGCVPTVADVGARYVDPGTSGDHNGDTLGGGRVRTAVQNTGAGARFLEPSTSSHYYDSHPSQGNSAGGIYSSP
jgi:hypothetical protein